MIHACAPLFTLFFAPVVRPAFQHEASLKKPRTGTRNSEKSSKSAKIIIETHPQPKAEKKLRLGGVKPLKLTTITTLSAVFPKAQRSQSEAKKGTKIEASGTHNDEKSGKRAPQKTMKNKTTKN